MGRRIVVLLTVFALFATACRDDTNDVAPPGRGENGSTGTENTDRPANRTAGPVRVRLSQGEALAGPVAASTPLVEGDALGPAEIAAVVDRLPAWIGSESEQVDFNRPPESLRPPVSGTTLDVAFPADGGELPPETTDGPLEVLRHQPDGAVGIAPFLSVTFNQPMVALGTVEQSDAAEVPVVMEPEVPGRWQWIGTRTLRFEHDPKLFDRLPMATSYTATIPAGTPSAAGNELASDYTFSFETPSPSVQRFWPAHDSLDLEPLFVAVFDQQIDPAAVLEVVEIQAGDQAVELRLASDNEIADDEDIQQIVDNAVPGTTLVFRAVDPFAPDTALSITIGPEIPSTEGPNTTDAVARHNARTYAPLAIDDNSCEPIRQCQPEWGFSLSFNNELDGSSVSADDLVIEPAIPGASIDIRGNSISVRGELAGSTVYRMTVPAALTDVFGQTYGADEVVEFHIVDAYPFLDFNEDFLITLDPLVETQTMPLQMRGHDEVRVRAYEVSPSDWSDYVEFYQNRWDNGQAMPTPPWPEIYDEVVATGAPDARRYEARIDLAPVFEGNPGMVVLTVEGVGEFANLSRDDELYWQNQPVLRWVQSTNLGADLITDNREGVVWVTDLRTGEPVDGASVTFGGVAQIAATNDQGLTQFDLPDTFSSGPVTVSLGDDTVLVPGSGSVWDPGEQAIWHVVDDRSIYRPGETVNIKGWVRLLDLSEGAELKLLPSGETLTYTAYDGIGTELATGDLTPSASGGFDFTIDLPPGANLGNASVQFQRPSTPFANQHRHWFQIEEFRRPEFEVTARAETAGPYLVDDPATVAVDATYFSGGALPNAPVDWRVVTQPTSYSPPGWDDYTFGSWEPWFPVPYLWFGRSTGLSYDDSFGGFPGESTTETFSGTTDAAGSHYLAMAFEGDGEGRATTVSATASVTDVNRQQWSATTDVLVHPGELYVGLQSSRTFVRAGDPLDINVIVADIDGAAVAGRSVTVVAERTRSQYNEDGEWAEVVLNSESCTTQSTDMNSTDSGASCTFNMEFGGRYRIVATVSDDGGRESRTEMTRWVSGGDAVPSRRLELQDVTVVPDKQVYAAGETAELFVESPFGPAHGLMTVSHNGLEVVEAFEIAENDTVLEINILDEHIPTLDVNIELVGVTDRAADDGTVLPDVEQRPAFASGRIELSVPPVARTLTVEATPADPVTEPGASTSVNVNVTDANGNPVEDAEMLVIAVDEAVLALAGYDLADPIDTFYQAVNSRLNVLRGRSNIRLADPAALVEFAETLENTVKLSAATTEGGGFFGEVPAEEDAAFDAAEGDTGERFARSMPTGASAYGLRDQSGGAPPIEVRSNFDALALWDPEVSTDANGNATVDFDLPDSLTRYRIMVVAVDGVDQFGSGSANLTARLPLQVRPSAPRFLNFGDEIELPVVVQNLTDDAMDVDVILEASNLEVLGAGGQSVTVPANDRVEVRFPVATESAGTTHFRVAAASATHADAATVSLPVYTPATAEAFATYGVIDEGATIQPMLAPEGVIPQFGGLEVTTSSTAVQALTDAVLYMMEYEYQSADAFASRILTITALRDVLEAFDVDGMPTPAEFDSVVAADIQGLVGLQGWDGGWSTWRRNFRTSPYRSVHAMHALYEAQANGYSVPSTTLQEGTWFLQSIEEYIPQDWSQRYRDTVVAYSLFVRGLNGDIDSAKAVQIWNRHGVDLGLDAVAWLWPIVQNADVEAEIARQLGNRVTETPSAATFVTSTSQEDYLILRSDRRTDGIVLDAMIRMDPESDLIPKIVNGLIGNQRQGRWNNAQENTFILMALNNYFDTFEATTPDFVARVWLGDLYAAEHEFEGRSTDSQQTVVPMADVIAGGDQDLVLAKDGDGRLYYRLGLRYAPDDFDLDPLDRGFVVERTYEAVGDESDVQRDADGTWRIKAGADVRVTLTMVNDSRRTNMSLIDPLPAGLEATNPALAVVADVPVEEAEASWWNWAWYDHQNLRDDRVEAFADYLWAGTHEYTYVARATTPGSFVVPPTRAEEIYSPEVFGRSGSDLVIVG